MTAYTRHTLIRQVIDETGLVEPSAIAAVVEERTTDDEIRAWFRETLKHDVRVEHLRRRRVGDGRSPRGVTPEQIKAAIERKKSGETLTKPQMVRDSWRAKISAGVSVDGAWKHLSECSSLEVLRLAEARYRSSEDIRVEADKFKRLAAVMDEHGVETVGDLPADVGLQIL